MSVQGLQRCPRCGLDEAQGEGFAPSDRGRQGKWCRACLRAATHYRRWLKGDLRWPFPIVYVGTCPACGGRRRAGKPSVYCSRACKDAARNERLRVTRVAGKPERSCLQCAKPMPQTMRADARFCSEQCNSAAHGLKRGNGRLGPGRRREIERAAIIERDQCRCHVCGKQCRADEIHIDHVLPLARGGTHDESNLAVACATCNLRRRHMTVDEFREATWQTT